MRRYSFSLLISAILAVCVLLSTSAFAYGVKYKTAGMYTDASGNQHVWKINDAHTLIWDGEPYIPVGGAFTSRYISQEANDENYQADVKALEAIKAKGITDIILKSTGPITSVDPAALQRIIDYLEANGFTYGIEMNDGPKDPLKGYVVSPNEYRLEGPTTETRVVVGWPGVDSAIFVIVNRVDNKILGTGGGVIIDGKLTINLGEPLTANQILLVYPRKVFKPVSEGGEGDIWSGFGEYRDRVLAFFKQVKLGSGFRFFLEPFTSKMDFTDEMSGFVPDSSGFRLGLEAYLAKRHIHEGGVNTAWGLKENLDTIEDAARLIPLWASGRGVPYMYDRASARLYSVDTTVGGAWRDILDYRDLSAQEYMNSIADALKKNVANVPVVFKNSKLHRIYANPFGMNGFDGLGVVSYGSADIPVKDAAGPAYSLAEESAKTMWFIVAATATSDDAKALVGYPSSAAMTGTLDLFREVGCKGFFIDSLQALPEDTRGNFSLVKDPQQLEWLSLLKSKLTVDDVVEFKPMVVHFPIVPQTGAVVKRLAPGTWWLPTLRTGRTTYIGDGLGAYSIMAEDKTYLWSSVGPKTITLKSGASGFPSVAYPEGQEIQKKKDGLFSVTLTETPTVLRGMDFSLVFPYETAEREIALLEEMIPEVDKEGYDTKQARNGLESAKTVLKNGQPLIAYGIAQTNLQELMLLMGGDLWVEGELSQAHNFDEVAPAWGASGGLTLLLNTKDAPPLMPYSAKFILETHANSSYEVWVAGSRISDSSPVQFAVDGTGWSAITNAGAQPEEYAPGFSWYKVGTVNLYPGRHTFEFRVEGPRESDGRYYYAIDAMVLSPRGFKPNGVQKPY